MKFIIDSNILFSAIIKDSLTRKIILVSELEFLLPSAVLDELEEHKELVLKKSGLSEENLNKVLFLLMQKVQIVPSLEISEHYLTAKEILKGLDIDDAPFIACCLQYKNAVLWSNDSELKKQKVVKVLNTKQMLELADLT
ncbi:MAG: PIN domain-containing protein [archaeon]